MKEENKDEYKKAYNYVIWLLGRKDYSKDKIYKKLNEKGYCEEVAHKVVEITVEKGYLNEENYTRAKIKSLIRRNYSKSYISRILNQEKLEFTDETIDALFIDERISENDQINLLIDKKLRNIKEMPQDYQSKQKLKNKVLNFLYSKGHSPSMTISKLTDELS